MTKQQKDANDRIVRQHEREAAVARIIQWIGKVGD